MAATAFRTRQSASLHCIAVMGLLSWVTPPANAASTTNFTVTGVAEFTAAYQAWDGAGFAKAAATFTRACEQSPDSCTNFYWRGVAEFHRVLRLLGEPANATNRQESATALNRAVDALVRAIQLDESHGESHAVLSTVYGLSIAANPPRGLWLGLRVIDQEKQARKHSPDDPRVLYLAGMNRYHGPSSLGGKAAGLKLLLAAEKLFEAEAGRQAGPVEPRWGRSACLVYIGKTYAALGKPAEAQQYYRKAREVNPQDKLAQSELEKRKK